MFSLIRSTFPTSIYKSHVLTPINFSQILWVRIHHFGPLYSMSTLYKPEYEVYDFHTHTQNKKKHCINQCMNINLRTPDLFLDFLLSLVWSSSDEWEAVDASESLGLSSSSITASKCSSIKDGFFMDATGCKARYSADVSSTSKFWRQNKKEKRHHRLYRLKVLVCFYDTCLSNTYISGR